MNNLDNIKETKEIGTLTKKELEMMTVLWGSDTALTASEILKATEFLVFSRISQITIYR